MALKFEVHGADRETGEDLRIIVDALDEVDAETIANRRNIVVSSVALCRLATAAPQKATKKNLRNNLDALAKAARGHAPPGAAAGHFGQSPHTTRKQCPKCREWIDKGATKCPHCRSAQPAPPWILAITAMIFIVPALWCSGILTPSSTSTSSSKQDVRKDPRQERIERQFSVWNGSHRGLTEAIKAAMNDPGSYEHVETVYRDEGTHLWVRTTFRGKNAFGGVIKNWIAAKVDLDGNVLQIIAQGP